MALLLLPLPLFFAFISHNDNRMLWMFIYTVLAWQWFACIANMFTLHLFCVQLAKCQYKFALRVNVVDDDGSGGGSSRSGPLYRDIASKVIWYLVRAQLCAYAPPRAFAYFEKSACQASFAIVFASFISYTLSQVWHIKNVNLWRIWWSAFLEVFLHWTDATCNSLIVWTSGVMRVNVRDL